MSTPKVCKHCKQTYMQPCDGKDTKCSNLLYLAGIKAKKGKK